LGAELLQLLAIGSSSDERISIMRDHLDSGRAYERFEKMVHRQGGDLRLPRVRAAEHPVLSPRDGTVRSMQTERIGQLIIELGGGRRVKGDPIDPSVGLEMLTRIGDTVAVGQPIARLFARQDQAESAMQWLLDAMRIE
jgi:thymidine phosphorylase